MILVGRNSMDIETQFKKFEDEVLSNEYLTEYQKEVMKDCFFCGWEAYEMSINENNLVLSDINSLGVLAKHSKSISGYVGDSSQKVYVKLPTKSPIMLTATTENYLNHIISLYENIKD